MPATGLHIDEREREQLRNKREKQCHSRQSLADAIGLHVSTVTKIERGEKQPSAGTLDAICHELGLDWQARGVRFRKISR